MKKKKCYIYTRVSTAAQTEGYSLEAQQERLREYADYKNPEIAGEYCDAGKSGKSIVGRPSFLKMLEDISSEKDNISFVLVFKLSRFGRNAADILKSLQLKRKFLKLQFVTSRLNSLKRKISFMEDTKEILTVESIRNCVYIIRGQQVMLDSDLASIYGYEVKRLNEQVKRNINRFPEDFMFQLTREEVDLVKSQNATSRNDSLFEGQDGGRRKMPYAFTEQGIYMLATVLRGELAEQQSIFIMRAFKEMRHYIRQNQQFVTQSEMSMVTAKVSELSVQMAGAIDYQKKTDKAIEDIQKSIDTLNENFVSDKDFKNFIIYKGQKFEADAAYIDIYQQARKSIYVVDDYMNTKSLQLLSQKNPGVEVVLFTENGHGKRGFLTTSVVSDFINQYPPLRVKPNPDCHDRLIVLDYGFPSEQAYHCGASSKDAGRKLCAINKVESVQMIRPVIDALLKLPDKRI